MKYIYALLISLFLPTVVFAQSVPVSWLRNVASGFLTPLNINDSVGIGTVSPQNKLEISGTSAGATLGLLRLSNIGMATSTGARLLFTVKDSGNFNLSSTIDSIATDITTAQGKSDLVFSVTNIGSLVERMRILASGNVGVGTTNPESKLQIGAPYTGENIGSVPVMRILGSALDTTPQTMLRLNRILNQDSFYSGGADFNIKSYGVSGTPFLPKTQLDIALKSTAGRTETADVIVMSLRDNGNVGIGTTTPVSQLTVQKTIVSGVDYPALSLSRDDTANALGDSLGDIDFWSNDASTDGPGIGSRIRGVVDDVAGRSYGLSLWTRSGNAGTPISEKMRIASDGKVGVGTSSPLAKLDIYDASASSVIVLSSGYSTGADSNKNWGLFQSGFNYGDFAIKESNVVGGNPISAGTTRLLIQKVTGNVGIGTTTPWTRLAVTGSTTIAGGPLIVLGSANTPISADTDWYRQFGIFRKDINDYSFMTLENRNGGSNASVDFLFNNDRTTSLSYYWDLGFNSSAFNNPAFGLLNVPNAAYEYVTDGPKISATATTSSAGYFDFITGGLSSSRLRITSTGNVGIGTTSPTSLLSVAGTIAQNSAIARFNLGGTWDDELRIVAAGTSGTDPAIRLYRTNGVSAYNPYEMKMSATGLQFNTGSAAAKGSETYTTNTLALTTSGNVGIGTTTPRSTLSVGSVNDATNSYAQIDSVNGAPTAGDCDTDLERGRMIIDYSNNRFYICNGATRGWDYSALTD